MNVCSLKFLFWPFDFVLQKKKKSRVSLGVLLLLLLLFPICWRFRMEMVLWALFMGFLRSD